MGHRATVYRSPVGRGNANFRKKVTEQVSLLIETTTSLKHKTNILTVLKPHLQKHNTGLKKTVI